jgi:hypothetical protein
VRVIRQPASECGSFVLSEHCGRRRQWFE